MDLEPKKATVKLESGRAQSIVRLIGNFSNRPDLEAVQKEQVRLIDEWADELYAQVVQWKTFYTETRDQRNRLIDVLRRIADPRMRTPREEATQVLENMGFGREKASYQGL